jgi:uncharacterized protein YutE (UPF0331/DUF86 family)
MTDIDLLRIRDLLGSMAEAQTRLRELGQLPLAEFLADYRNTESSKYLLIVAIEAAIDMCNHIVARQGGRAPQDYADCFTILTDLKVITADLTPRLKRMARFRNLLVHLYWKVDDRRVYEVIHQDLGDLDTFRQQVSAWAEISSHSTS